MCLFWHKLMPLQSHKVCKNISSFGLLLVEFVPGVSSNGVLSLGTVTGASGQCFLVDMVDLLALHPFSFAWINMDTPPPFDRTSNELPFHLALRDALQGKFANFACRNLLQTPRIQQNYQPLPIFDGFGKTEGWSGGSSAVKLILLQLRQKLTNSLQLLQIGSPHQLQQTFNFCQSAGLQSLSSSQKDLHRMRVCLHLCLETAVSLGLLCLSLQSCTSVLFHWICVAIEPHSG